MTITIFALDSTGLPHYDKGPADPAQPRMVAIAAALYSARWELKGQFEVIIGPNGSASNAGARDVHGITERERELFGVDTVFALAAFMRFVRLSKEVATFNMPFARRILDAEFTHARAKMEDFTRGGLMRTCIKDLAVAKWAPGGKLDLKAAHAAATGFDYVAHPKVKTAGDVRAMMRILSEIRR